LQKILIAEDDSELRHLFSYVLTKNGYGVTCVSNGCEALDAIEQEYFDLLISDLGMEPMDGFDLIRQIRAEQDEYFQKLPAIALTGYVSAQDRELALTAGFQNHIAKPVKLDNLLSIIVGLL
jgi:CheY-like chemotaxis protein